MGLKILKTGAYLPEKLVPNQVFEKYFETSDQWIKSRTGIGCRRFVEKESTSDLVLKVGEAIGLQDKDKIDLVLVATFTSNLMTPSLSTLLQKGLGLREDILTFDFNMACSGFVGGLKLMDALLEEGRQGILIGAETISPVLDLKDRGTAILFGDGAGGVLVEKTEKPLHFDLGTSTDHEAIRLTSRTDREEERSYLQMKGQEVFRFAKGKILESVERILAKENLHKDDIDYFLFHQANARIIKSVAKKLDLDLDKCPMNIQKYGNTSAASLGILLDELAREGRLKRGMKLLFTGFGAGFSWATTIIEW